MEDGRAGVIDAILVGIGEFLAATPMDTLVILSHCRSYYPACEAMMGVEMPGDELEESWLEVDGSLWKAVNGK